MAEGVLNVGGALQGKAGSTVIIDGGSIFAGSVTGSGKYTISLDGRLKSAATLRAPPASPSPIPGPTRCCSTVSGPGWMRRSAASAATTRSTSARCRSRTVTRRATAGTTLTILHGGAPVYTFTHINNPGAFTLSSDDDGGTEMSVCYARGTMIRTPDGEVAVEALTPGAQVMTTVDGLLLRGPSGMGRQSPPGPDDASDAAAGGAGPHRARRLRRRSPAPRPVWFRRITRSWRTAC